MKLGRQKKKKFNWRQFLEKHSWPIGISLIGLTLVATGLISYFSSQEKTLVEIIPTQEEAETTLWVDLEGAVEKPGVYELEPNSRINDLLIKAGGLSAHADRNWVEKNLNLAQKLVDGTKIYLPRQDEISASSDALSAPGSVAGKITSQVNLNTASASELDTLWGIGQARAESIITARPYESIEDLKTQKVIPENVYERIKDQITVY